MAHYLLYSIAGLGISFLLYHLFLKKEQSLVFNRFFLLGSLVLCLVAPTLNFDGGVPVPRVPDVDLAEFAPSSNSTVLDEKEAIPETGNPEMERSNFQLKDITLALYLIVSLVFLSRFFRNLVHILQQTKNSRSCTVEGLKVIPVAEKGDPFSFFKFLFINEEDFRNNNFSASVVVHEAAHSRQYHSIDILIVEILSCFIWFNPFFWLYKRAIVTNHEYLADAEVIGSGIDRVTYSEQLINSGNMNQQIQLISGFNFIQTKNRLIMLHSTKSSRAVRTAKIFTVLSLFAAVFTFSSFTGSTKDQPFVVILDAGHGGTDAGTQNEKDINLNIARQLKSLSEDGEIEVILIREDDRTLFLSDRTDFIKSRKADMVLSLHCNSSTEADKNGAVIFFSDKSRFPKESFEFSRILTDQLVEVTGLAEISSANFLLLRESNVPSILVEMGYLTGSRDKERLQDPVYQTELARQLYKGLHKIKESR